MAQTRITSDNVSLGSGIVGDEQVQASANIDADKLQHLYKPGTNFDTAIGGTPASREEIVFVAGTSGTIRGFHALLNVSGTTTDIDFDLKVNGTSVLAAPVNITNAAADGAVQDGTVNTPSVSVDDIISIEMAVTSATGASGAFAWPEIQEGAA